MRGWLNPVRRTPHAARPSSMNHFLALSLDDATRDRLERIADRLKAWDLPALWTHGDDYHLTLRFLGKVDDDEAHYLPSAIDLVAGSLRRPRLRLSGLGGSGGRSEPRTVFAAVTDAEHACAHMHRDLGEALDLPVERDFTPHVTLCRPQPSRRDAQRADHDWPALFAAHGLAEWGDCTVTDLVLFRSHPERTPRYAPLARWPLATS